MPNVEPPEPTRLGEVVWLQPYPDTLLDHAAGVPPGPEARYEQAEASRWPTRPPCRRCRHGRSPC